MSLSDLDLEEASLQNQCESKAYSVSGWRLVARAGRDEPGRDQPLG
jgi:hypothetical protein